LTHDDAIVLERVILRDLRIGCETNTANKVWKGLILDPAYQRCSLIKDVKLNTWDWDGGVYSQLKSDGSFCNVNIFNDGSGEFMTRTGNTYPVDELGPVIRGFEKAAVGFQYHGELLVFQDGQLMERAEGNGVLNSVLKGGALDKNQEIYFVAWDMIPLEYAVPKGKYEVPYKDRLAQLESQAFGYAVSVVETRIVHNILEAYEHYIEQTSAGLEGTILKNPKGFWKDSTSKDCVKLKVEAECEVEITGHTPGKGKRAATFGALTYKSSDGLVTGKISGFTDDQLRDLAERLDELPGMIVTVRANALTKVRADGTRSLFLPRFIEIRLDKTQADDLPRIQAQFDSAVRDISSLITQ
jgi:DNA ligase 1